MIATFFSNDLERLTLQAQPSKKDGDAANPGLAVAFRNGPPGRDLCSPERAAARICSEAGGGRSQQQGQCTQSKLIPRTRRKRRRTVLSQPVSPLS